MKKKEKKNIAEKQKVPTVIIVKRFRKEETMKKWLDNKKNVDKLKVEYSPKKYTAILNLVKKQVEIHER